MPPGIRDKIKISGTVPEITGRLEPMGCWSLNSAVALGHGFFLLHVLRMRINWGRRNGAFISENVSGD